MHDNTCLTKHFKINCLCMLVMFDFFILGLNSNLHSHVDRAVVDSGVPLQSNIGTLSNQLSKYFLFSKSESTNKAYTHCFQRWTMFIRSHGYSELPAKSVHVALYITHLLNNGAYYASVNSTIYSFKWMHNKFIRQISSSFSQKIIRKTCA